MESDRQVDTKALCAKELCVRYKNGALGISDVGFSVAPGEIVALFGPNGAGKSTSVRAVGGFLRTEGARLVRGSVELFGRDVTNREPSEMHSLGVSIVPERRKVFGNMTVRDNLIAVARRRDEALDMVYEMFPVLKERKSQLAGRLSGGQQQMLAIARALLARPGVLIVDELTLGLHSSLYEPLLEIIAKVASAGAAVILVDESTGSALRIASYCYLLSGGHVVDHGLPSRFVGSDGLAASYAETLGGESRARSVVLEASRPWSFDE